MSGTKRKHEEKVDVDVVESYMAGFVVVMAPSYCHTIKTYINFKGWLKF